MIVGARGEQVTRNPCAAPASQLSSEGLPLLRRAHPLLGLFASIVTTACGRLSFDPRGNGEDAAGDSSTGADGQLGTCMPQTIASCPDAAILDAVTGSVRTATTNVLATNHGLQSTICGSGNGAPEVIFVVRPTTDGSFTLEIDASSAFLAVYVLDGCCGGAEVMCGIVSTPLSISRTAGQPFTVVVDGGPSGETQLMVTGS